MRQLRKPFQHTQTLVINEVREQVQEDMITYLEGLPSGWVWHGHEAQEKTDALCQIVVDNFKRLKDE